MPKAKAVREPAAKHENQVAAEYLANVAKMHGYLNAKAVKTRAIGGQAVRNGWVVNIHDKASGIGMVVGFYGRRHCQAYLEFHGTLAGGGEMGQAFMAFLVEQRPRPE
jgi:hypothetical protein